MAEIITPAEAFERGMKKYFTGKPCKHGHVAERYLINGYCFECSRLKWQRRPKRKQYDKTKAWRAAHPNLHEYRAEEARKWRAKHPEVYKAIKQRYRATNAEAIKIKDRVTKAHWRKQYPEAQKARELRYKERLESRLEAEAGRPRATSCELCSAPGRTTFDHCHDSGVFRGWLCDRCNRTLGQVHESSSLLRKMADYLEEHHGREVDSRSYKTSRSTAQDPRRSTRRKNPGEKVGES
jgi:hypothetical protein